ncbi:peptide/nickel transport system ATP-binding protein/oligopeptide transport system ATP-binding protein [Stackebrandtia albiflava]|uniref:Peptide/nickel transport system ATP-binding protein/oligopeptide transport system ATP-binding protein n=1 Tax=Stackebrandtia albiflava TaxID=406432 RepID=A0A562UQ83_9ACTN|nr:ATP-binding cassette domain-containing protein [Stackebrandtia albiflava]TWJ07754.1 peptide/nickel transport system ATP-binding protein/oligopeptide transport system ATP-binding protein [Stackebrandtia albiflava]
MSEPLLRTVDLVKHYRPPRRARRGGHEVVHALCGVSVQVAPGRTLGIVGESGSGKTTLLRTLLGLERATAGTVEFAGRDVTAMRGDAGRMFRADVSVVFQDPYTSLDPRMTVSDLLSQPARIQRRRFPASRVSELLDQVRLPRVSAGKFPHEFSGGQRQRIAIARALALEPRLIVLDEPVSALDVSVQAEIVTLLRELQEQRDVSYLFVAHDLAVVADLSHEVGVMYGGQMVEHGATSRVLSEPAHPYTRALLAAVPVPDPRIERAKPPFLRPLWPTEDDRPEPCPHGNLL